MLTFTQPVLLQGPKDRGGPFEQNTPPAAKHSHPQDTYSYG